MTSTVKLMESCRKELKTCMLCRLANKATLALHSTNRVEWVVETIEEEEEAE